MIDFSAREHVTANFTLAAFSKHLQAVLFDMMDTKAPRPVGLAVALLVLCVVGAVLGVLFTFV